MTDMASRPRPPLRGPAPRAVLLTGATGSLGSELAAELLARTPATVYCLVRGTDPEQAAARLRQRLLPLTQGPYPAERIVALRGDLTAPGLGLSDRDRDALAATVDTIHHCGASVHLAAPYDELAPGNVQGTRALIAFAQQCAETAGRPVGFVHVSTLATVFPVPLHEQRGKQGHLNESTPPGCETLAHLGYPRSKIEAEQAVRAAHGSGPAVTVMRPGLVHCHSQTGRTSDSDLLVPLLRAAVALGALPTGAAEMPAAAVDTVARGIVELSLRADAPGSTYHLVHTAPLPLADVFAALPRAGYRLEYAPVAQWWQRVEDHAADPEVLPLSCLGEVGRYIVGTAPSYASVPVRSDATWQALTECGMPEPPLDHEQFDRLVAGLVADGTLPPPPRAAPSEPRAAERPEPSESGFRIDGIMPSDVFDDCLENAGTAAAACEAVGYGAFWLTEQHHDPLLLLGRTAAETTSIGLGTSATIALARSPMTLAMNAHDVQTVSRGRLLLGLGTQTPAHLANRFSMPSDRLLGRMREYVAALHAIWACWNEGKPLDFRGTYYRHTLMTEYFAPPPSPYGPPPVLLTAVGPRMAELAGEIADGLIAPPFATRHLLADRLLPAAERGLATSGRSRDDFTVMFYPLVVTGKGPEEQATAEDLARRQIALWCSPALYRPMLEAEGLGALNDELNALSLCGDPEAWARRGDLITDEVLHTFAVVAPPHEVGPALRHRFEGLADRVCVLPPYGPKAPLWHPATLNLTAAALSLGRQP